jgi:hypothetical protein
VANEKEAALAAVKDAADINMFAGRAGSFKRRRVSGHEEEAFGA